MKKRTAIILAAGKGTRMKSELPKVLCRTLNRSMIHFVLDRLDEVAVDRVLVVVGHRSDLVREELAGRNNVEFVEQTEQLGTGHAVQVCVPALTDTHGPVLIVTGDSPLLQTSSVESLFAEFDASRPACILGTLHKTEPHGLGRIVRTETGEFLGIVEQKDATPEQQRITEVNMSTYLFNGHDLLTALELLRPENKQREYYLTDCPGILKSLGKRVLALPVLKPCEALSINTIEDLAAVEAEMRKLGY